MKPIINIIALDSGSHGADAQNQKITKPDLAAGIDLDIFNADDLSAGGERFWEAFWRTQLVYGGVSAGQALKVVFSALDSTLFEKLHHDVMRLCDEPGKLPDAEKDDIFGMMIFLLCIERGDPQYDPIEQEGYEAALAHFSAMVKSEQQRRFGLNP